MARLQAFASWHLLPRRAAAAVWPRRWPSQTDCELSYRQASFACSAVCPAIGGLEKKGCGVSAVQGEEPFTWPRGRGKAAEFLRLTLSSLQSLRPARSVARESLSRRRSAWPASSVSILHCAVRKPHEKMLRSRCCMRSSCIPMASACCALLGLSGFNFGLCFF